MPSFKSLKAAPVPKAARVATQDASTSASTRPASSSRSSSFSWGFGSSSKGKSKDKALTRSKSEEDMCHFSLVAPGPHNPNPAALPPRGILRNPRRSSLPDIPVPASRPRIRFLSLSLHGNDEDEEAARVAANELPEFPMFPKIHYRWLLRRIDRLLQIPFDDLRLDDYLNMKKVQDIYMRDINDCGFREYVRDHVAPVGGLGDEDTHVLGVSLRHVSLYASNIALLGGYRHELPIVVRACVQELSLSHRIREASLLLREPSPETLSATQPLISIFNNGPTFGLNTPLSSTPTPHLTTLLRKFILSLPQPLMPSSLRDAFWSLCVEPSLWLEAEVDPREGKRLQIAVAQGLLRLMPTFEFSLMSYLCAFFARLCAQPESGVSIHEVGRVFGDAFFAKAGSGSGIGGKSGREKAGRIMVWILQRWEMIADGLFGDEKELCSGDEDIWGRNPPRVNGWDDDDDEEDEVDDVVMVRRKAYRRLDLKAAIAKG